MPQPSVRVFISYAHEDETLKDELRKQLAMMVRLKLIEIWDDRAIVAGASWEEEISDELERADLILLLVSPDFIDSDYCFGAEMARAVERHVAGSAKLVPVLMRDCQWTELPPIAEHKIQAIPRDGKVATDSRAWPRLDAALKQVADELRVLVDKIAAGKAQGDPSTSTSRPRRDDRPAIQPLLAELCNRGQQEGAFDSALRATLAQPAHRPSVFVLYGEIVERDRGFCDRLTDVNMKVVLELEKRGTSVEQLTLGEPSDFYGTDAFRAELGNRLLKNSAATANDLFEYLRHHAPPMFLISLFDGADALKTLRKLVPAILGFWNQWPDLPPQRELVHCLIVRFDKPADPGGVPNPNEAAVRDAVRRFLRRLMGKDGHGYADYPTVAGRVLPELEPVKSTDAETWAGSREVKQVARIAPEDVRRLFDRAPQRRADGRIPMDYLVPDLLRLAAARRI